MGIFDINLDEKYDNGDFSNLPDGAYEAAIDRADIKTPKAGGNEYLGVTLQVTKGEYTNRLIFVNFMVQHADEKVRNMARSLYQKLCRACNFEKEPQVATEFLNFDVIVKLKTNKKGAQYTVDIISPTSHIERLEVPEMPVVPEQVVTLNNDEIPF